MSGGKHNYLHLKVEDVIDDEMLDSSDMDESEKEQIKEIYRKASDFFKSVEWYDSDDSDKSNIYETAKSLRNSLDVIANKLLRKGSFPIKWEP